MKIGVLGAGQLGRMLALAGYPLGMQFRFLDPNPQSPAGDLAELVVGDYQDYELLEKFHHGLDRITYEFENVPVETARWLNEHVSVYPPPQALEVAQDRLLEKRFLRALSIPTPDFEPVDSEAGLEAAARRIGLPAVLKMRRLGYDGKGQVVLREWSDLPEAWHRLQRWELLLECFVPFRCEVSILAVRTEGGECLFYPLVENVHRNGILHRSIAPSPTADAAAQAKAEDYARRMLEHLDYVGVLAIEFFLTDEGLLTNEIAPRVHNSGHWTIEGAETSQFENHLRAICGLPLGSIEMQGPAGMLNLVGKAPDRTRILEVPGAHLHLYNKHPRAGRKLGHVTVRGADHEELRNRMTWLGRVTD